MNPAQFASNHEKSNVLIVDDNPANLRLLNSILSAAGHRVRPATNGPAALSAAQTAPPDLILLDIMLPDMDGYEICRQLKADARTKDIPVIFISALSGEDNVVKSFAAGGVDYVSKPFRVAEVMARVKTHLTIKRLQNQLQEQVAELDAFAHTVAHDLKAPLSLVTGFSEYLNDVYGEGDPDLADIVKQVMEAGYKSVNIIDELLLLASVKKRDIPNNPIDMQQVVKQAQRRLVYMIDNYDGDIILPAKWPKALGYAPWIEEVWVNYISNALKFGGESPIVELGATPLPDNRIRFWVRDHGVGISQEKQETLFTEFVRLDDIRAEGHGLGLSIVKRIVEKLDGEVGVDSKPDEGSEFYFILSSVESASD